MGLRVSGSLENKKLQNFYCENRYSFLGKTKEKEHF